MPFNPIAFRMWTLRILVTRQYILLLISAVAWGETTTGDDPGLVAPALKFFCIWLAFWLLVSVIVVRNLRPDHADDAREFNYRLWLAAGAMPWTMIPGLVFIFLNPVLGLVLGCLSTIFPFVRVARWAIRQE